MDRYAPGTVPSPDSRASSAELEPSPNGPLSFAGRIGVLAFNSRILAITLGSIAATAIALFATSPADLSTNGEMPVGVAITLGIVMLACLPLALSALALRAHDRGHGAWILLLFLVPVVGSLFALYLGLVPGSDEPNRFGARREPSALEKIGGIIGFGLAALSIGGALWMMAQFGFDATLFEGMPGY